MTETKIEIVSVSKAEITDDGRADYTVELSIGNKRLSIPAHCYGGWIRPSEMPAVDGAQAVSPRSWSVRDANAGDDNGRPRVWLEDGLEHWRPLDIYNSDWIETEVHPFWCEEWQAAVTRAGQSAILAELDSKLAVAYIAAARDATAVRRAVAERITAVCAAYQVVCPEPDPVDVYEYLPEVAGLEIFGLRAGDYLGCGPVLAWETLDGYEMRPYPRLFDADLDSLRNYVGTFALRRAIAASYE